MYFSDKSVAHPYAFWIRWWLVVVGWVGEGGRGVGLTLLHSDKLTSHHEKASHSSGLVSMATVMRVHHQERRKTEMVVKPLRM